MPRGVLTPKSNVFLVVPPLELFYKGNKPRSNGILFKDAYKKYFQENPFKVHLINENFLIQTGYEDRSKIEKSLINFHQPAIVISNFKLQKSLTKMNFSEGSQKMMSIPNAGGSSLISEVLSFEFLKLFCHAEFCKTEMEIQYFPQGSKITDYSVMINGEVYGVSVTRAFNFRGNFTEQAAKHLLQKKLNGIYWSSKNVIKRDAWKKQILHCFCPDRQSAKVLENAYRKLKKYERGNSIVVITICNNDLIFKEKQGFSFGK